LILPGSKNPAAWKWAAGFLVGAGAGLMARAGDGFGRGDWTLWILNNGLRIGDGGAFEIPQPKLSISVDCITNVELRPSAQLLQIPCWQ
jgi:hypothetical protein